MKTPEFYRQCGYEDVGYAPPELSSEDTYPDYIQEEALECVERIQKHQNFDTFTFAFLTDLHYAINENHEIRLKRTLNAYKEIASRVQIDKMILGGDYTNEGCKAYKSDCFRELRVQLKGLTYFPVHGNHDDGSIWDIKYIAAEQAANHLTHEELYKLFYNHLPAAGACFDKDSHGLYYYCNDEVHKVRYICLDSGDIPYMTDGNGKLKYNGQWYFALSQKQIDWLVSEALTFDEEGWRVLFFTHSVALPSQSKENQGIRKWMTVLNDLLDCYQRGDRIDREYYEQELKVHLQADFSHRVKGEIIGVFVGDYHIDKVERSQSGIPYILTANCVMYYAAGSPVPRRDGDKTELLFDIVTVDPTARMIYVIRVGAGEDREVAF